MRSSVRAGRLSHTRAEVRRFSEVFPLLAERRNLWDAWREFRRNKGGRASVWAFEPKAAAEVVTLAEELHAETYRPEPYRLLFLHTPKRRLIAAASVRDRVVHHAVVRTLGPIFDPTLIEATYACLEGRGSHRARWCRPLSSEPSRSVVLMPHPPDQVGPRRRRGADLEAARVVPQVEIAIARRAQLRRAALGMASAGAAALLRVVDKDQDHVRRP